MFKCLINQKLKAESQESSRNLSEFREQQISADSATQKSFWIIKQEATQDEKNQKSIYKPSQFNKINISVRGVKILN